MKVLLFGELGSGALARSFEPGLAEEATVVASDPYGSVDPESSGGSPARRLMRRVTFRSRVAAAGATLVETVEHLRPDTVLVVKGRGIDAASITRVRDLGVPVVIFYPDHPDWARPRPSDVTDALVACTLAVTWSEGIAAQLDVAGAHSRVLPFGFDDRWWVPTPPGGDRHGIVFLGTWSPRRERYLASLEGLPLRVAGTGWERAKIRAEPPIREAEAGALLAKAVIGVNLLHPQCVGAHNMRTREITATGALQLTDPGVDGTPLRPPESCAWFESVDEFRARAEYYLAHPAEAAVIAGEAQALTRDDTYVERGRTLRRWLAELGQV